MFTQLAFVNTEAETDGNGRESSIPIANSKNQSDDEIEEAQN